MIPLPQVIKREVKGNPVPANLNRKSLADIEADKKMRRQATADAIRREYEHGAVQKFPLASAERPSASYIEGVRAKVEAEFVKDLKFGDFKPREMPDFTRHQADVKLNVAMLKREKHLIDKEEREHA